VTNYAFSETIGSDGALKKEDCMMKKFATTTGCALGLLVLVCSAALPSAAAWAQTPAAQSFGVAVNTPTASGTSPFAVLPPDGGLASDNAPSVNVPGLAGAENAFAIATGAGDLGPTGTPLVSAVSNSTLESVNLLNGLITADAVLAFASSAVENGTASSNAEGSQLANLVVNGVAMPTDVAPNTRISLPGVGYVVLNEQILSGDGVTNSGMTVNMIHVYLQSLVGGILDPLTGQSVGGTLQSTGEIIVGSASSSAR